MPTENRSSNTEMVRVPRELADRIQLRLDHAASAFKAAKPERDQLRAVLARPAEQHEGEPVGWQFYQNGKWWNGDDRIKDHRKNTEDAGYPVRDVFAHADPGEVERLREDLASAVADKEAYAQNAIDLRRRVENADLALKVQTQNCDTLRAQLAERDAQLRDCRWRIVNKDTSTEDYKRLDKPVVDRIDAALSASAEPSTHAWTCQPCKIEQPTNRPCDVCGAATELKI